VAEKALVIKTNNKGITEKRSVPELSMAVDEAMDFI
jgi:hypothetical protein